MTSDSSTTGASAQVSPVSPEQFIDRHPMSRRQWLIVTVGLLTMIAEGLDAIVVAFVFPKLEKQWGTPDNEITVVVTLSILAMVVGGAAVGPLADRYGRKGVTVTGLTVFSLGTAAMAFTHTIGAFAGLRIVACLGLGAVLPTMMALVADWIPARRRGQMIALAFAGVTAGTTLGGLLSSALIPAFGWPTLLAVCGLAPLALIPLLVRLVPESVSVLAARGRPVSDIHKAMATAIPGQDLSVVTLDRAGTTSQQRRGSARKVVLSRSAAPTTFLLWLCFLVGLGVVALILSYLPMLIERMGLTSAQAGATVAVFGWGGLVGQLAVSFALKRYDRFQVLAALWAVAAAGLAVALVWAVQFVALLAGAFVLGFCLPGANSALQVIAAVAYPSSARATGISWANSVGKLGPVFGGLFGGLMVDAGWSLRTVLVVLAVPVGLCILAVRALRSRSCGQDDGSEPQQPLPGSLKSPMPEKV